MEKQILNNLTVVVPIKGKLNEPDTNFLKLALTSIESNKGYQPSKVLIVHTTDTDIETIKTLSTLTNVSFYLNDSVDTDFCSQINLATKNKIDTEYFSILELDDEYSAIAFDVFNEYSTFYKTASVLVPAIFDIDMQGNFLKFNGVDTLSRGFVQEGDLGVITHELSKNLTSQILSGAFIKTTDFNDCGGLKKNIKISFMYEFLLRATHQDLNVVVLPKLCYLHRNLREGSYLKTLNDSNITKEEVLFWYESAKKEYYYPKDRVVEYKIAEVV